MSKIFFGNSFTLKHCHNKYKTQKTFDKAVDFYLLTLKLIRDRFLASDLIEKHHSATF